jgi:hypothetical protein
VNSLELGPALPTVCTAGLKSAVESGDRKCKARSQASLMRFREHPGLHNAAKLLQGVFSGAFSHSS